MSKDSQNLVKRAAVIRECTLVPPPTKRLHLKNNIKKSCTNYPVKLHVQKSNLKTEKNCKLVTENFGEK